MILLNLSVYRDLQEDDMYTFSEGRGNYLAECFAKLLPSTSHTNVMESSVFFSSFIFTLLSLLRSCGPRPHPYRPFVRCTSSHPA